MTALAGGSFALITLLDELAPLPSRIEWAPLAAGLLAGAAWLVADVRRLPAAAGRSGPRALLSGSGWWPATVGAAVALAAGVLAGVPDPDVVALLAVAVAGAAVVSGRAGGHAVAAVLVVGTPWFIEARPAVAATAAVAGALVLAAAAVVQAWRSAPRPPRTRASTWPANPPPAPPTGGPGPVAPAPSNWWQSPPPVAPAPEPEVPGRAAAWLLALSAMAALYQGALMVGDRLDDAAGGRWRCSPAWCWRARRSPPSSTGRRRPSGGPAWRSPAASAPSWRSPPDRGCRVRSWRRWPGWSSSSPSSTPCASTGGSPLWALPVALPVLVATGVAATAPAGAGPRPASPCRCWPRWQPAPISSPTRPPSTGWRRGARRCWPRPVSPPLAPSP